MILRVIILILALVILVATVWGFEQRNSLENSFAVVISLIALAVSILPIKVFGKKNWDYSVMGLITFCVIYAITRGL